MNRLTLIMALYFFCIGCLTTRSAMKEADEKKEIKSVIANVQRGNAETQAELQTFNEEFRNINGRIELLEVAIAKGQTGQVDKLKTFDDRMTALEQKIGLLMDSMSQMEKQLEQVQVKPKGSEKNKNDSRKTPGVGNILDNAELAFESKKWRDAIVGYKKYLDTSPAGNAAPLATYKIGVCLQELGMREDAKVFYKEVLEKFPKHDYANRASHRLKKM